jgi:hypothetical protein
LQRVLQETQDVRMARMALRQSGQRELTYLHGNLEAG